MKSKLVGVESASEFQLLYLFQRDATYTLFQSLIDFFTYLSVKVSPQEKNSPCFAGYLHIYEGRPSVKIPFESLVSIYTLPTC